MQYLVLTYQKSYNKIQWYVYIKSFVSRFLVNSIHLTIFIWRCTGLANIKSAKKRILVTDIKTARNKAIKSKVKTYVKKVEQAVAENDKAAAQAALVQATSEISKAASKGVYHKNTASRKVSRLAKAVAAMA